jgi:hypothetical protein
MWNVVGIGTPGFLDDILFEAGTNIAFKKVLRKVVKPFDVTIRRLKVGWLIPGNPIVGVCPCRHGKRKAKKAKGHDPVS